MISIHVLDISNMILRIYIYISTCNKIVKTGTFVNHACRLQQGVGEVNDQKEYISLGHFIFIIRICLPW